MQTVPSSCSGSSNSQLNQLKHLYEIAPPKSAQRSWGNTAISQVNREQRQTVQKCFRNSTLAQIASMIERHTFVVIAAVGFEGALQNTIINIRFKSVNPSSFPSTIAPSVPKPHHKERQVERQIAHDWRRPSSPPLSIQLQIILGNC